MHPERPRQSRTGPTTQSQTDDVKRLMQAQRAPGVRSNQIGESLCENARVASTVGAKELVAMQDKGDGFILQGQISRGAAITAVEPMRQLDAVRTRHFSMAGGELDNEMRITGSQPMDGNGVRAGQR